MEYSDEEQDSSLQPTKFSKKTQLMKGNNERNGRSTQNEHQKSLNNQLVNMIVHTNKEADRESFDENRLHQATQNLIQKYSAIQKLVNMKGSILNTQTNSYLSNQGVNNEEYELVDGEDDDEDEPTLPKNELPNFGGDDIPSKPIVYSHEKGLHNPKKLQTPSGKYSNQIKHENNPENLMSFGDNSFKEKIKASNPLHSNKKIVNIRPKEPNDINDRHNISADLAFRNAGQSNKRHKGYEVQRGNIARIKQVNNKGSEKVLQTNEENIDSAKEKNVQLQLRDESKKFVLPKIGYERKNVAPMKSIRTQPTAADETSENIDNSMAQGYKNVKESKSFDTYSTPSKNILQNGFISSNQSSIAGNIDIADNKSNMESKRSNTSVAPLRSNIRKMASDNYFSEKIEHLINLEIKSTHSEKDIDTQNTVIRRYIIELRGEVKRMLDKTTSSEVTTTKRGESSQKLHAINEELKFNDEIVVAQVDELLKLEKALHKASNVEYVVELEERIKKIDNEKRNIERERRGLEFLTKKELYTNSMLNPDQNLEKKMVSNIGDKRELHDRLKRQISLLSESNKKANDFILEQKYHCEELNSKFQKLLTIAEYQGLNTAVGKKKESNTTKKRYADLKRTIDIIEKSLIQKIKQHDNELDQIKKEISHEKKTLENANKTIMSQHEVASQMRFEIQEYNNLNYHNLWDPSVGNYLLKLEEATNQESETRVQVTPNEISSTNIIYEENTEISPTLKKNLSKIRESGFISSISKSSQLKDGGTNSEGQVSSKYDHYEDKQKMVSKQDKNDLEQSIVGEPPPFVDANHIGKVVRDQKPSFGQSFLLQKMKILDKNDLSDFLKNKEVYDAYDLHDEHLFSNQLEIFDQEEYQLKPKSEIPSPNKNIHLQGALPQERVSKDYKFTLKNSELGEENKFKLNMKSGIQQSGDDSRSSDDEKPKSKEVANIRDMNLPFDSQCDHIEKNYQLSRTYLPNVNLNSSHLDSQKIRNPEFSRNQVEPLKKTNGSPRGEEEKSEDFVRDIHAGSRTKRRNQENVKETQKNDIRFDLLKKNNQEDREDPFDDYDIDKIDFSKKKFLEAPFVHDQNNLDFSNNFNENVIISRKKPLAGLSLLSQPDKENEITEISNMRDDRQIEKNLKENNPDLITDEARGKRMRMNKKTENIYQQKILAQKVEQKGNAFFSDLGLDN